MTARAEHYYNFTAYRSRFNMPAARSGGVHNFWYSIEHGHITFVVFSTEHDYSVGSEQVRGEPRRGDTPVC